MSITTSPEYSYRLPEGNISFKIKKTIFSFSTKSPTPKQHGGNERAVVMAIYKYISVGLFSFQSNQHLHVSAVVSMSFRQLHWALLACVSPSPVSRLVLAQICYQRH